jgi:hypothetical protein
MLADSEIDGETDILKEDETDSDKDGDILSLTDELTEGLIEIDNEGD